MMVPFSKSDIKRIYDQCAKALGIEDAEFDAAVEDMAQLTTRKNEERKQDKMKNLFNPAGAVASWDNEERAPGAMGGNADMMAILDAIHEMKRRFDGTEATVRSLRQDVDNLKICAETLEFVAQEMSKNAEQSVLMARTVLAGIDRDTYKMLKTLGEAVDGGDVDKLTDVAKQAKAKVKQYEATGIISSKAKEIKVVVPKVEAHMIRPESDTILYGDTYSTSYALHR